MLEDCCDGACRYAFVMSGYMFERDAWSPSRIRKYLQCPRAWWLSYRSGLAMEGQTPVHWRRGSVAHAALEAAFKAAQARQDCRPTLMDGYLPQAEQGLADAWAEYDMPDDDRMRDVLREQIRLILEKIPAPGPGSIAGVERDLRAELAEGVKSRAIVDLAFWVQPGWLHVRDWKTYSRLPSPDELRTDPQMALCGHLAALEWPEASKITVGIYSVPLNREARVELTAADRAEAADRVIAIAEMAETDTECKPTPSEWCDTCSAKTLCPIFNPNAGVGPETDMDEVAQMREAMAGLDGF